MNWMLRDHAGCVQPLTSLSNADFELLHEKIMSHDSPNVPLLPLLYHRHLVCLEKRTGRFLTSSETPLLRVAEREAHDLDCYNEGTTEEAKETDVTWATQWPSSGCTLSPASLLVRLCLVIVNAVEILEGKSYSQETTISHNYAKQRLRSNCLPCTKNGINVH